MFASSQLKTKFMQVQKLVGILVLIVGLSFSAIAQDEAPKYKVSLGGEYLYPAAGQTIEFYSGGYGASLQVEYKLTPKLNATASGGYIILTPSELYQKIFTPWVGAISDQIFYPVKAGLKYNFYKRFYAAAEAGASISKDKVVRETSLAYAGGVGTNFIVSTKSSIDVGLRYEAWSLNTKNTYSFVGLRAAYVFGFGK